MKCIKKSLLTISLGIFLTTNSYSEVLINPSWVNKTGKINFGGNFVTSEVEYEIENLSRDIERKIVGFEAGVPIDGKTDAVFQFGLVNEADYENVNEDGDGYIFGAGFRRLLVSRGTLNVIGYGVLTINKEEVDSVSNGIKYKSDFDLTELQGGIVGVVQLEPLLSIYGGGEIIPYSNGSIKITNTPKIDYEREDALNLRIGAQYLLDGLIGLRGELALMSEETLTFSGNYSF
ncbi:MAG: hypothetical protein CMP10_20165 [Zetaproteobacteria bacterium]|nr:hypothetical protein [Pseudobdellovibrionaceae bacterium]